MTAYLPLRLASALLTLSLAAAWAQPVPYDGVPGGAEWATGDFVAAYQVAVQVDSPVAQLLASRAAADQAVYVEEEPASALDWLGLSESAARRSLELDPAGPLATAAIMALARAQGEAGLHRGGLANARLPGELRSLFERVLDIDPENPDALVAYAVWHFALTEIGIGWLYGADRGQVLPLMERGMAAAPEQINLRVEYARVLVGLGLVEEGREQAEIALELPAASAADAYEQERARELLRAL